MRASTRTSRTYVVAAALFAHGCGAAPEETARAAGPAPVPEPTFAEPLPDSGVVGGCSLALGFPVYDRHWMFGFEEGSGPDDYSRLFTSIEVSVECAHATRLDVEGWIVIGDVSHRIHFRTAWLGDVFVDPWDGSVAAGRSVLRIRSDDGPFHPLLLSPNDRAYLSDERDVRAVLRIRGGDHSEALLGAMPGGVGFAS
jgi:hypothetical protein